MKQVRITVLRKARYDDLIAEYENPIKHACDLSEGDTFVSVDGRRPDGLCESAWESMRYFVEELSKGGGNFYDGWMKDPCSAMISCNDGFRPVFFTSKRRRNNQYGSERSGIRIYGERHDTD